MILFFEISFFIFRQISSFPWLFVLIEKQIILLVKYLLTPILNLQVEPTAGKMALVSL